MQKRGFTLIELIVVIAIISFLAAIITPGVARTIERSRVSATLGDYKSIKTGAMSYNADTSRWPATCSGSACSAGFVNTDSVTGWDGPYLDRWPASTKWGGTVNYTSATGTQFGASSAGERFITLAASAGSIPQRSAEDIDTTIDGAVGASTGQCRYTISSGAVDANGIKLLVSRDGTVS